MVFLVYISSATKLFDETELVELLQKARKNNVRNGITGMLLYSNGNFIQVIEGEEDKVQALHQKITTDSRHTNIFTLLTRPLTERMFSEWSMGFKNLDQFKEENMLDLNRFLQETLQPENLSQNAEKVYKLLLNFRETMR